MQISARVTNARQSHTVTVSTAGREQHLTIAPKVEGFGSSINGGELLFLALATCYCNDLYREAAMRGIALDEVEVEVVGQFGSRGEPAAGVSYRARIRGNAPDEDLQALLEDTDRLAEIQNTLRQGCPVRFVGTL